MIRSIRYALHLAGCCAACQGTGVSGDVTSGGLCWDCLASGHPHQPTRLMLWQQERHYRSDLRWLTDRPFDVQLADLHEQYDRTVADLNAALMPREDVAA